MAKRLILIPRCPFDSRNFEHLCKVNGYPCIKKGNTREQLTCEIRAKAKPPY